MPLAETITYLEMTSREELRPSASVVKICRRYERDAGFSRSLYADVGGEYNWIERSNWTDDQWLERLASPDVETWLTYTEDADPLRPLRPGAGYGTAYSAEASASGYVAGFFELEMQDGGNVEIVYFGLLGLFLTQE